MDPGGSRSEGTSISPASLRSWFKKLRWLVCEGTLQMTKIKIKLELWKWVGGFRSHCEFFLEKRK